MLNKVIEKASIKSVLEFIFSLIYLVIIEFSYYSLCMCELN